MKTPKPNKLFALLTGLSKEEMKEFDVFVNSPYFNSNKNVCKTISHLKKNHPDYTVKNAEPEKVYAVLFPGKKFNEQILNNLYTEITKLLMKYFAVSEFEKDEDMQRISAVKNMTEKKLITQSLLEIKKGLDRTNKDDYDTRKRHKIDTELYLERIRTVTYSSDHKLYLDSEMERLDSQTAQYLLDLSFEAINIYIYKNFFPTEKENQISKIVWETLDFKKLLEKLEGLNDIRSVYLKMFLMGNIVFLGSNNEKDFFELKEMLYENFHRFYFKDKHFIWDMMVKIIDNGLAKYYNNHGKEVHDINKFCIENGALIDENSKEPQVLHENRIRNCFAYAIRVSDWEWAEKFVENYKDYMSDDVRDNTYHYLIGQCKMTNKKFGEAMEHFSKVKLKDAIINVDIRNFYLKCLYEEGYWEELLAAIDSFNHFLDYQEIPWEFKQTDFKSYFKYLKIMIKIKTDGGKLDSAILFEAENLPSFLSKGWVISKLKELI